MNSLSKRATALAAAACCAVSISVAESQAQDRPNIILLLADDLGFSSIKTYGGDVETPSLTALADSGAKFNNYYVQPRCSPTRAALMTGHQNHKVGFEVLIGNTRRLTQNHVFLPELLQDEGYSTYLSGKWHLGATDSFGSLGSIPAPAQVDPRVRGFDHAFTFDGSTNNERNWQINQYRLLSDDQGAGGFFTAPDSRYTTENDGDYNRYNAAGQYTPLAPGQTPEFYQTDAIIDYSLDFLSHHRARNAANGTNDPFFQYVAFGAPHFWIEAPAEVTNKYATVHPDGSVTGTYAGGWDAVRADRLQQMIEKGVIPDDLVISPRGDFYAGPNGDAGPFVDGAKPQVIPWDDVPESRKPTLIRAMAVYAAMVDVVDQQIGRLVDDLKANGEFDNTLIMFMTDNGGNPEGDVYGLGGNPIENDPPTGVPTLAELELMGTAVDPDTRDQRAGTGWATVQNTPFRNYKHYTHEGGIKSPLVVSWPDGLHPSLTNSSTDYADGNNDAMHVNDVMPTILDLLNIELPDQYTALNGTTYDVVDFHATTESWADLLTQGVSLGEREFAIEHEGNRMYRKGDMKLVSSNYVGNDGDDSTPNNTIASGESPTLIGANEWELYDLSVDPAETNNLAGDPAYQAILDELKTKYALWAFQTNVNATFDGLNSDFDFDGNQDADDLQIFVNNWLTTHGSVGIDSYMLGDRNGDGVNDLVDWVLIRQDFLAIGAGAILESVSFGTQTPEPGSLSMWLLPALIGTPRRHR
ncbi:MAG: sulfatase-like hydrolase/transferase [Planctomycetota bacterium]